MSECSLSSIMAEIQHSTGAVECHNTRRRYNKVPEPPKTTIRGGDTTKYRGRRIPQYEVEIQRSTGAAEYNNTIEDE